MYKIVLLQDKKNLEFYYKLLNYLLSNNYFVSKVNKNSDYICKICTGKVENSHHLIFKSVNVQHTWERVNFGVLISNGNHIIISIYSVRIETTAMYN